MEHHLLAIVADEGPNNVLLAEAAYPVIVDIRHLTVRMDTGMGYADLLLQAVHKHAVFRRDNVAEKFAAIRSKAEGMPVSAKRRVLAEIDALELVVARRFAVVATPFHLKVPITTPWRARAERLWP
ncbi:hypothetical protein KR054_006219 [Drosophila jambulina]|nr:hypothetical protein KR054_006219 [Drosophila jambulina]